MALRSGGGRENFHTEDSPDLGVGGVGVVWEKGRRRLMSILPPRTVKLSGFEHRRHRKKFYHVQKQQWGSCDIFFFLGKKKIVKRDGSCGKRDDSGSQTRAQHWTQALITVPVPGTPLDRVPFKNPLFLPQVIVLKMEKSFLQLF